MLHSAILRTEHSYVITKANCVLFSLSLSYSDIVNYKDMNAKAVWWEVHIKIDLKLSKGVLI